LILSTFNHVFTCYWVLFPKLVCTSMFYSVLKVIVLWYLSNIFIFVFSVAVSFINCYSVSLATKVQNFFTVTKLIAIAVITVGGFVMIGKGELSWKQKMNMW